MKVRVLVASKIEGLTSLLQQQAVAKFSSLNVDFVTTQDQQQLISHLVDKKDASILIAEPFSLTGETWNIVMNNHSSLKWFQSTYAGLDSLFTILQGQNTNRLVANDVKISKMGDFGNSITEYCLQHILNVEREFVFIRENQRNKKWVKPQSTYRSISDLTIGVMGYGDIGKVLAKTFKGSFNARIHAIRNKALQGTEENVDQMYSYSNNELDQFLGSGLDYLINIMPSTPETRGMLNMKSLSSLDQKPNGVTFINVGRGDIISEKDLIAALDQNVLRKAVLDVYQEEPLSEQSALWTHEKVIMTPHVAAISFPTDVARIFYDNLQRFMSGESLKFEASWLGGY